MVEKNLIFLRAFFPLLNLSRAVHSSKLHFNLAFSEEKEKKKGIISGG
jgi:hypothetical protein